MNVLLDSGVWFRRFWHGPLHRSLIRLLDDEKTEFWLSPLTVAEIVYKWSHKGLPCPAPDTWLSDALLNYRVAPLTMAIGQKAGAWKWPHGDPVDRLLAATALEIEVPLVHCDTRLRELSGFPQRYFPNVG